LAKGQQKSNREVRKPKAAKSKPVSQASPFSSVQSAAKSGAGKKR
jgi:hypothetical protein